VYFPKSPRHLAIDEAKQLVFDARGRVETVCVTVDPDDALADQIAKDVAPDFIQLHGAESPARVAAIKERTGLRVVKAIPVSGPEDVMGASTYAGIADKILFDAKAPAGADLPGGNGIQFDWRVLSDAPRPFVLSGGLDADNVQEAIQRSGATIVDVSSGVESSPGVKDAALIAKFVRAARASAPQQKKAS
ncbi:MAG: phosphoribosylanthranilate isomerase, partial [Pseudomonadota bacterium]